MLRYRPYIDGLRAIAVTAVVLFHFEWTQLSGGFLGVDVFFVISGFLITQLLMAPSDLDWRRRLGDFYLRRARRILPALLVTSLVVAAIASLLYLPEELTRLGKYLVSTPLMLANVASVLDGGYFNALGAFMPVTHFWSLAVEEQFYLLYPLVLIWTFATLGAKRTVWVLVAIAALSLAICIRGELRHSVGAYYLMPDRAWQLMVGALAAACPFRWRLSRIATEAIAFTCLGVLLATFFLLDEATGFPKLYVMIPCAATALLLTMGGERSLTVFGLLAARPMVFTGRISYSLYLWHAPILAFAKYYAIRDLTTGEIFAVGLLTYLVAWLCWRFIENPVRYKIVLRSDRQFLFSALSGCIAVGVIGAWFWCGDGLPGRFSRDIQVLVQPDELPPNTEQCMTLPLDRVAAGDLCRFGANHVGVRKVVLWGDSHALDLVPAFQALAQSADVQINFAGHAACKPLLDVASGTGGTAKQKDCEAFNTAMLTAVRRLHPDVTILSAFWYLGSETRGDQSLAARRAREQARNWGATVGALRGAGSRVCVVLDVPRLPYFVPYALAMARRRGIDPSFIYVSRADVLARYAPVEEPVRALEAANALRVVDTKQALCPGERCEIEAEDRSLYRDSNHLSQVGAMYVRDALAPCVLTEPALNTHSSSDVENAKVAPPLE